MLRGEGVNGNYYWDWEGAERKYKLALVLDPSSPRAHNNYARFLGARGRFEEAIFLMRRAQWLPPNEEFHCDYVRNWVITKAYWRLAMDDAEREAVYSVLEECEQPVRGLSR